MEQLKKILKNTAKTALLRYRAATVENPVHPKEIAGKKVLSPVDQTMIESGMFNHAGHLTSEITNLLRMHDETMLRSALAKLKQVQVAGNNYGDMSNEEIVARIKPREVQTVVEYDRFQSALEQMEYDRLSPLLYGRKTAEDVVVADNNSPAVDNNVTNE